MTNGSPLPATPDQLIALAESVAEILEARGLIALLIGGFALAVHNYQRTTKDLDIAVSTTVVTLRQITHDLLQRSFSATFRPPDASDPLGGVIDVEDTNGAIVQIVNFDNSPAHGFPRVIADALATAKPPQPGSRLRIVPLAHLVALKLYAGGPKSLDDVRKLLANNPDADVECIRQLCEAYRLRTDGVFD